MAGGTRGVLGVCTLVCGYILFATEISAQVGFMGTFTAPKGSYFPPGYKTTLYKGTSNSCAMQTYSGCGETFCVSNLEWRITTEDYKIIHVTFSNFHIPPEGKRRCCPNYFEVFDGASGTGEPLIGWCGIMGQPEPVTSTGNSLFFRASATTTTSGIEFHVAWDTECVSKTLTSPNGTVTSPGFPKPLQEDVECKWTISVEPGYVVDFTFDVLEVGPDVADASIPCDSNGVTGQVSLYDSELTQESRLLQRFCTRKAKPGPVSTSGRHLTIVFKTKHVAQNLTMNGTSPASDAFKGSYVSRKSLDTDGEEKEDLMLYGQYTDDLRLRKELETVSIPNFNRYLGIPLGKQLINRLSIHSDGKLSLIDSDDKNDSMKNYICAYCTDIDHSDKDSDVIYNMYTSSSRSNENARRVIEEATNRIRRYSRDKGFEARLTLLASWHNVKHKDFDGTVTFQAAIVSNYTTTYAVILYKKDAMRWKPRARGLPNDIGIGLGLHDQSITHFRPERYSYSEEALSADILKGNTGRTGIWLYKLGDVTSTPESQCKSWYERNVGRKSERDQGFAKLPSCPCSQKTVTRTGTWIPIAKRRSAAGASKQCFTLSKAASHRHLPYSEMCCYNEQGNFVATAPDAGTCTAFNPIFSSLNGDYLREDWEGYHACCERSSLCQDYIQLRPVPQCVQDLAAFAKWEPWKPPPPPPPPVRRRRSWTWGDPHVRTLDEKDYTFNGWGEYTLVTFSTSNVTFTLQGRTSLAEAEDGKPTSATVFTALGAEENGVRVFVGLDAADMASLVVYANGTDYSLQFRDEPDFLVDMDDFQLIRENKSLVFTFPSGCGASVTVRLKSLEMALSLPFAFHGQTRGLMGNFNGVKGDDFILPNGTVLPANMSEREIFRDFGEQWRINEEESVMRYGPREGPSDYHHPEFTPLFLDEQPPEDVEDAKAFCGPSNLACIYDYFATGSESFALDTKQANDEVDVDNAIAKNTMPTFQAPSALNVTSGSRVTFKLQGYDPDENDVLTFHAEDTGNELIQVDSVSGVLNYLPDASQPFVLRVYVQDTHVQSPPQVIPIVICTNCSGHGTCDFSRTSFSNRGNYHFQYAHCVCRPAWDGPDCERDRNGCAESPCLAQQTCTDLTPEQQGDSATGYDCGPCPEGFNVENPASKACVDVDECAMTKKLCDMNCFNTKGSYMCTCNAGYWLDPDGHTCWDMDECQEKTDKCEHICQNTLGSYSCRCEEGYSLDSSGTTCTQDDATAAVCTHAGCSQGCKSQIDLVTGEHFPECFCRHGYDLDFADNETCVDHDECADGVCPQLCFNYDGGFSCYCLPGYTLNDDKRTCAPCPRLRHGPNCELTCTCSGRGVGCDPIKGCVCQAGWAGDTCEEDVNECDDVPSVCGRDQVCDNTRGSYTCSCREGYRMDSTDTCEDIDECDVFSDLNTCSDVEQCVNVPGGFYCQCRPGYSRMNDNCADIDECSGGNRGCEHVCVNVPGSYNCDCFYGYRLGINRVSCTQVSDVCAHEEGLDCAHGCTLSDADDRAVCFCRNGFQLASDEQSCVDLNECTDGTAGCSHKCTNTEGGFLCSCPAGMKLDNDGRSCLDCPVGRYGSECSKTCACAIGSERCDVITGCVCLLGWQGEMCEDDVNECDTERVQQECRHRKAGCINYPGGYRCDCEAGFRNDSSGVCQDIDECALGLCDQQCENSPGSYRCLCYKGFTHSSKTGRCQDVDECRITATNNCTQRCVNTPGSYLCACNATGYTLDADGVTCIATTTCNRKDCPVENGGCSQETCFCNNGYTLTGSNSCERKDVDWCEVAGCDHDCEETPDGKSFICSCRAGYLLQKDGTSCAECPVGRYGTECTQICACDVQTTRTCDTAKGTCTCKAGWEGVTCSDDIDECAAIPGDTCLDNSRCLNTPGSYVCACTAGYFKDAFGVCFSCRANYYGENCAHACNCSDRTVPCDRVTGECSSLSSQVDADEPTENKEGGSNTVAIVLGVTLTILAVVCVAIAAYCYLKRRTSYRLKGTFADIPMTSDMHADVAESTSPEDAMLLNVDITSTAQMASHDEEPPEIYKPDEPLVADDPGEPAVVFSDDYMRLKSSEDAEGPA